MQPRKTNVSPFYATIGAGVNNYLLSSSTLDIEENKLNAWEMSVGADLTKYFSAEIGYRNIGNNELDFISGEGITLSLNGAYPLSDNFSVIAEIGGIDQFLSDREPGHSSAFFGAGMLYQISKNFAVQALFRQYKDLASKVANLDSFDSNYYGIKIQYNFNTAPKPIVEPLPIAATPLVTTLKTKKPDTDQDGVSDDLDLCPNTPIEYKVDVDGCIEYEKTISQINIDAKFGFNSAEVDPSSLKDIAELAEFMLKNPRAIVEIQGHASLVGGAKYNLSLSRRRAESVAKILSSRFGIPARRITARGYGETRPLIANTTARANNVNRRIEAEVTVIHDTPVKR